MSDFKDVRVLCFGSPMIDMYASVRSDSPLFEKIKKGVAAVFSDEKLQIISELEKDFKFEGPFCGGSVINSARILSLIGGKVSAMFSVGDDDGGKLIIKDLRNSGVDIHGKVYEAASTSRLYIFVTEDAQRTVLGDFVSSSEMAEEFIDDEAIRCCDYLFAEAYQLCGDVSARTSFKLLERIKFHDKKVILSLSSVACVTRFRDNMRKFLNHSSTTILVGNLEEFMLMFEQSNINTLLNTLTELSRERYEVICLTAGSMGAYIFNKGQRFFSPPPNTHNVVDTTGAGDFFAAGFLYGYFAGFPMDKVGELAGILAGDVISRLGIGISDNALNRARDLISSLS